MKNLLIFKTFYDLSLLGFSANHNSTIEITKKQHSFNKYHENTWSRELFVRALRNNAPKAIDLMFIPKKYWIHSTEKWEEVVKYKDSILSMQYFYESMKNIQLYKKTYIKNTFGYQSDILDLTRLLIAIEKTKNMIKHRSPGYPLNQIKRTLSTTKDIAHFEQVIRINYNVLSSLLMNERNIQEKPNKKVLNKINKILFSS